MYEIHRAIPTVRIQLAIIMFIVICASCAENHVSKNDEQELAEQSTLEKSERKDLEHITLDLYRDSLNNIYHRTIDVSSMVGDGYYRYTSYAQVHDANSDNFTHIELNEFLDTTSFVKVECKVDDGRTTCFEDAHYRYSLRAVADGGVLDVHLRH